MMKYLSIAILLLVAVSVGMSQGSTVPVKPKVLQLQLNDSVAIGAYYAASQADTSVTYALDGYSSGALVFDADDSASFSVRYFPSYDGVTFDDLAILIDSVSTVGDGASAANGIHYSMAIPPAVFAYPRVKFQVLFNAAGNGFTTPTYTGKIVLK